MSRHACTRLPFLQDKANKIKISTFRSISLSRPFSSLSSGAAGESPPDIVPDARWLSQTGPRIGKCLTFGCSGGQISDAGAILNELATDWREVIAGSQGFLTGEGRRGLWKHAVVWGEQDLMVSHVNNVTYLRYCESARVNWVRNFSTAIDPANRKAWENLPSALGKGVILRSVKLDFKFPMKYPDRISAFHKLRSLPEADHDSFYLDVIIYSEKHRRPVASAVEDIVLYNYPKGEKMKMGEMPFVLDQFRKTFELQEEAMDLNRQRAQAIEQKIRALEQGSWDRPDAVEDFGGSGGKK